MKSTLTSDDGMLLLHKQAPGRRLLPLCLAVFFMILYATAAQAKVLTLNFSYSATLESLPAYTRVATGSGSFSWNENVLDPANVSRNDLTAFSFDWSWVDTVYNPQGSGIWSVDHSPTFSYGRAELTSFSLGLSASWDPLLSLSTDYIQVSDLDYDPEALLFSPSTSLTYTHYDHALVTTSTGGVAIREPTCAEVLNEAVNRPLLDGKYDWNPNYYTIIRSSLRPNYALSLDEAARICGVDGFSWVQMVTFPSPSPFFQWGNQDPLTGRYNDPVENGYTYDARTAGAYPYYYGPTLPESNPFSVAYMTDVATNTLFFYDKPNDPCLLGPNGLESTAWTDHVKMPAANGERKDIQTLCPNPVSASLSFDTQLVGVLSSDPYRSWGLGFKWTDSFNGTVGGIATMSSDFGEPDPGSGTGGITIISFNNTVPEPGTLALLGIGLAGLCFTRRRKLT